MERILPYLTAIFLAAAVIMLALLLKKSAGATAGREKLYAETLESALREALRDLRGAQNALARAARLENQASSDRLSEQIDKRVARLADLTDKSLERIRATVDEKLEESLERRFALVSGRLEELHRSLGEMQELAGGVDDLKRILGNVKTRGIWGEMQLGTLLRDMLPAGRFLENAEVRPQSGLRVEFALRLPGSGREILLPIDAKFPQEDYQRLQQAREEGKAAEAAAALKQLERRLKSEAKDICDKYIYPPYSTDFGIMYLPSEGLFTEALNIPGLAEEMQRTCRVCLAGPTTLAALRNSLHMGFRTLAIRQKTSEVWQLLAWERRNLEELAALLEKTSKKLLEAQNALEAAARKTMAAGKRLEAVGTPEEEGGAASEAPPG